MAAKPKSNAKVGPKHAGGRPRRAPLSEKEDLEKCRGLARRSALAAMQGYVDQLTAMKTIFWQGDAVADVIDWDTRQNAQREILDRAGIVKVLDVVISDPITALMAELARAADAD